MEGQETPRMIYRPAAENGLVLGAYFSVLAIMGLMVIYYPVLSWVVLLMMLCVPFIVFRYMRRAAVSANGTARYADTALHGISMVIFATLIMSMVVYIYLKFINPDYIFNTVNGMIVALKDSGRQEDLEIAEQLGRVVEAHALPSAIKMVIPLAVLTVISGFILSLILAPIAMRRPRGHSGEASPNPDGWGKRD
ncbi:MAG: DUF4199 domain-containing protein [Muribaculaceae bacterium]|nr:DUF4199 domain-containing protein [Muribaculaceae bacterium]